jgi:hypothetical protein
MRLNNFGQLASQIIGIGHSRSRTMPARLYAMHQRICIYAVNRTLASSIDG